MTKPGRTAILALHPFFSTAIRLRALTRSAQSSIPDRERVTPMCIAMGTRVVIQIDPTSGEALLAKQNGRTGFLVHGGDPGGSQLLRRTNGCIRMMNTELADLINEINQLGENLDSVEVVELAGAGTGSCENNGTCGEGDPPPH